MNEVNNTEETYSEMKERILKMNYNDMMNICHYVDDYLQYSDFEVDYKNEIKKVILSYEFSKLEKDLDSNTNLYELMTSEYL